MSYQISDFSGDNEYSINCTGDVVVGDSVRFERATFTGSYRKPKFNGFELVTGVVVRDSYGNDKQQHTFSIKLPNDIVLRIKGRNLYKNGTWRKPWKNENDRVVAQKEKHDRGDVARKKRNNRRNALAY